MLSELRPALVATIFFTLLLGVAYPMVVTGVAGAAFPRQAGGSLVRDAGGQIVGSTLIAQPFAKPGYLHPRPSAAGANGYDTTSSGGSNLGPLSPDLAKRIAKDTGDLAAEGAGLVPADAVTTSGSGLDPDVSPANAHRQAARIAAARGASVVEVDKLIADNTEGPWLGVFGQPRVNVLKVNLALDAAWPQAHPRE